MAYPRNILPTDLTRLLCVGVTSSVLALGTAFAQDAAAPDTANMTEGERQAAEGAANLAAGGEDDPRILEVPAVDANRVYVNDPAHFAATTQQFIIDGGSGEVLGSTDGGFLPNPVISEDGALQAQVSTVFERVARGKRTDYVEVFDQKSLLPVADIELPNAPRFLVGTYPWMSSVTPGKNMLMFYQFSPAPAVGLVNLAEKKFERFIDVPDCYHMFPTSDETFYMHCRDGSMARVDFAGAEPKITHSEVFRTEDEHLLNNPAYSVKAKKLLWPTYTGKIFPIDLSGDNAKIGTAIEAFSADERKEGWAPGGWQPTAYHRLKDRIYLLADQRAEWTHKDPSRFVFVIDAKTGERLQKFDMGREIDGINVSQNAEGTLLYGLSAGERTLYVYDEETGKELRSIDELGRGPQVVTVLDLES